MTKPSGVRDRAMLETMYSTGLRRMEIVQLLVEDLDLERRTLFVQGKGKKDRWVEHARTHPSAKRPDAGRDDEADDGTPENAE